ncbi:hypothetical protein [Stenotrophomonas sp. RAC2]|uniref:hypothetical protein n=1 Tax=Stenotrophomonas sp. RAC2 TaxID=3064902 RepID=UPI0027205D0A|nr:hypothetical protein [Stenotrophomonas sp. RAC2]MDV9040983.1 hypothetical protein [Stenotrophomonas sp. RAC2]
MMDRANTYAGSVRRLFESHPQARLRMRDLCALAKADTVELRSRIRSAVRDLVASGFLTKEGSGQRAEYRNSGQGMRRTFVVTDEQREQCRADKAVKQAAYRASKRAGTSPRAPDKMTINRAKLEHRPPGAGQAVGQGEGRPAAGRDGGGVRGAGRTGAAPDGQLGAGSMSGPARVWVVLNAKGRAFAVATSEPPSQVFKDGERAIPYCPAAAAVDWKPIAGAPEDGRRLLLWDSVSERPVFGSWRCDNPKITHFAAEPSGPEVP